MATKQSTQKKLVRPQTAVDPRQLQLPGLSEFMVAMPNHLARSSLFSPVARGRRRVVKDQVLVSRSDAVLLFSGEQLDESDCDVWAKIMRIAAQQELGAIIKLNRGEFLEALGRNSGGSQYRWLHTSLKRLDFAQLAIESSSGGKPWKVGHSRVLHPITDLGFDDAHGVYTLRVDPRWALVYQGNQFALFDWDKRLQLGKNQDLAKSLQRLIATSRDVQQSYRLDWLKDRAVFGGRMRDFRVSLRTAFTELERVGLLKDARFTGETVTWKRVRESS